MNFTKTIRFRLTIWYSALVFVFCGIFILSMSMLLESYFQRDSLISHTPRQYFMQRIEDTDYGLQKFRDLDDKSIEFLRETRLKDASNVRKASLYSLIPLTILSFISGYFISGKMLQPIEKLNEEIKRKSLENFKEPIEFEDTEDEISKLINSFNTMSFRLGKTFDSQKEFVENASHELKTPLAIIQANIDAALDDDKLTQKELKEILKESKTSIKFMDKLTEDLLLLSVLEVGIEKIPFNMNDVLKRSVAQLETIAEEKGIKIEMELDSVISKKDFKGNDVLLERAFMNVIENAIKYSECKNIQIRSFLMKDGLEVSIIDDGKGITEKHRKKIFERFYRIDKSRSRKSGGSGLGLAIVKKVVDVHEGEISVECDKGCKFVFVFPF